jgi:biopolymer transport protein ExbB/TolQ
MATNTVVWIIVAVIAALIVVAALVWVGRNRQVSRRRAQADEIREDVRQEQVKVQRREALADETAAKARAAQAEAEAKAAEAARLQENAAKHHTAAAAHREELDERSSHADSIDPRVEAETDTRSG